MVVSLHLLKLMLQYEHDIVFVLARDYLGLLGRENVRFVGIYIV